MRTNLCTNPSFEVDTTGWTGGIREASGGFAGDARLRVQNISGDGTAFTFTTAPINTDYSVAVYLRDTGSHSVAITLSHGATEIASTIVNAPDEWTRYEINGTTTSTPGNLIIRVIPVGADNVSYLDAVLLEQADSAGEYFDGDTPDTLSTEYAWTGTAHDSTSTATDIPSRSPSAGKSFVPHRLDPRIKSAPIQWALINDNFNKVVEYVNDMSILFFNIGPSSIVGTIGSNSFAGLRIVVGSEDETLKGYVALDLKFTIYVDNDGDGGYIWPTGSQLSAGQKNFWFNWVVDRTIKPAVLADDPDAFTSGQFTLLNLDSSSHTYYITIEASTIPIVQTIFA